MLDRGNGEVTRCPAWTGRGDEPSGWPISKGEGKVSDARCDALATWAAVLPTW